MRIQCWMFGCVDSDFPDDYDQCQRCGAYSYYGDWIQNGWWNSFVVWISAWFYACDEFVLGRKCGCCRKRFRGDADAWLCSDECRAEMKENVPF